MGVATSAQEMALARAGIMWLYSMHQLINRRIEYMSGKATDEDRLDRAFAALADPVRRGIIARLSRGPATVNELAEPYDISLQAVSRHIAVLEQAGLVTRTRDAQRRPVHLEAAALESLTAWIDRYRLVHEQQFRRLDAVLRKSKEGKS
jgi:DNA-binding transcriptional ArsR family regulator